MLRRQQGRLAELEDTVRRSVREYPALLRFECALAHLYGELGRDREAGAALRDILEHDLGREYRDAEWLFSMALLSDVCAFLGDQDSSTRLYSLLLPYEQFYAEAPVEATFGSVARALGVLATTLRRFDDAERHFDAAVEMERRMGARPWLAHVQHHFAAMLFARAGPADQERARELIAEAVSIYSSLGMDTWAVRAKAIGTSG